MTCTKQHTHTTHNTTHNTTQHNTTQHNTTQHNTTHNTQHNTTQHNNSQHRVVSIKKESGPKSKTRWYVRQDRTRHDKTGPDTTRLYTSVESRGVPPWRRNRRKGHACRSQKKKRKEVFAIRSGMKWIGLGRSGMKCVPLDGIDLIWIEMGCVGMMWLGWSGYRNRLLKKHSRSISQKCHIYRLGFELGFGGLGFELAGNAKYIRTKKDGQHPLPSEP